MTIGDYYFNLQCEECGVTTGCSFPSEFECEEWAKNQGWIFGESKKVKCPKCASKALTTNHIPEDADISVPLRRQENTKLAMEMAAWDAASEDTLKHLEYNDFPLITTTQETKTMGQKNERRALRIAARQARRESRGRGKGRRRGMLMRMAEELYKEGDDEAALEAKMRVSLTDSFADRPLLKLLIELLMKMLPDLIKLFLGGITG